MLLKITGDPLWADRCEEIAFNSLPAAQTPDLKGLHYLTAANEPRLDIQDHYPGFGNGGNQIAYDPFGYRCCQHNVAMGWPDYAEELWLATADNGLCASLYADCEITAKAGDGATVTITEATDYPFSEQIVFTISAPRTARFPLYLRIPRWCKDPKITLNGTALAAQAQPLSYLVVERRWDKGDTLVLDLPARLAVRVWEKNKNAVSVDLGPLTFSLKIGEQWRKYNDHLSLKWPAFEVLPTTPWNYGLDVDPARAEDSIQVIRKSESMPQQPFTPQAAPIELRAKARKIPQWTYDATGLCAVLQASPVYTTEPQETVTLIPMGCAACASPPSRWRHQSRRPPLENSNNSTGRGQMNRNLNGRTRLAGLRVVLMMGPMLIAAGCQALPDKIVAQWDVWIGVRIDGRDGAGTQLDPLDGSTQGSTPSWPGIVKRELLT